MKPGNVAIIAACAGNLLEWYDCTVYALFATSIAGSFFPSRVGVAPAILTRFTRQANGSAMTPAAYVMSAAILAPLTMPFFERRRAAAGTVASQVPA